MGIGGFVDGIIGSDQEIASSYHLHLPYGVLHYNGGFLPSNNSQWIRLAWTALILIPLSCWAPDMSYLSKFSAAGLSAIGISFALIISFSFSSMGPSSAIDFGDLFPSRLTNASHFFGISTFCYGIPPLTFVLRDSLPKALRRTHFLPSIKRSLDLVFLTYLLLGVGVAYLYRSPGVEGDILKNLPDGSSATIIRGLMILVCLVSYPLCAVPATQILESKLFPNSNDAAGGLRRRIIVRVPFILISTAVGGCVPGFVDIVSLIGCFSVGLVSYVLPPLFYLRLNLGDSKEQRFCKFLFILGSVVTLFSTYLTVKSTWFQGRAGDQGSGEGHGGDGNGGDGQF